MLTRLQIIELLVFFLDELRRKIGREHREAVDEQDWASARWWRRLGIRIKWIDDWLYQTMDRISAQQVVFFSRGDNLANLNRVMLYIKENEHTDRVKVVTVVPNGTPVPPKLAEHLKFLDEVYPEIDIEFVVVTGKFSPTLIQSLSTEWNIPTNLMFIGSPGDHLLYGVSELGGVRLII